MATWNEVSAALQVPGTTARRAKWTHGGKITDDPEGHVMEWGRIPKWLDHPGKLVDHPVMGKVYRCYHLTPVDWIATDWEISVP